MVLLLFTAAITPGPNNLLMLRIGLEEGVRAVLAPATGVVLGGIAMLLGSYAGMAHAFAGHPALRTATALVGACCVSALGVRLICSSFTVRPAESRPARGIARSVLGLFLFQFVNPKAWLLVLTVTAAAGQGSGAVSLATLIVLFIAIPYFSLALWAGGGSLAARVLRDARARACFDRASGAVLALSALLLLHSP